MFSITCNGGRCRVLTTLQLDGQNSLMPHFHVVALLYRLQPGGHVSYPDLPPLAFENEVARFGLEKNQLRCDMKLHVATSEEARALVDPALRDWEMEIELARGPGELRFIYENAEIIDRTPAIPGVIRGHVMVAAQEALLVSTGNLTCHITRGKYPDPPVGFHLSPDAESILVRFRGCDSRSCNGGRSRGLARFDRQPYLSHHPRKVSGPTRGISSQSRRRKHSSTIQGLQRRPRATVVDGVLLFN